MYVTKSLDVFYKKNLDELKKIFIWKSKINDPDIIKESLQDFFLYMKIQKTLEKFDEKKSSFETYISTCLFRRMSSVKQEKNRIKRGNKFEKILFDDKLHGNQRNIEETLNLQRDWFVFTDTILSDPHVKKTRKKVLRLLMEGLNGVEIADKIGLTTQAVSTYVLSLKKDWKSYYL